MTTQFLLLVTVYEGRCHRKGIDYIIFVYRCLIFCGFFRDEKGIGARLSVETIDSTIYFSKIGVTGFDLDYSIIPYHHVSQYITKNVVKSRLRRTFGQKIKHPLGVPELGIFEKFLGIN